MIRKLSVLFLLLAGCLTQAQNRYVLTDDSRGKAGVEYGEHIYAHFDRSAVFPGTAREVDIYVPAEYDGKTPACVCVFQDGMGFRADTVVSNLIHSKEIPVMILVAASPGRVTGDFDPDSPRADRTYEYDTPSPRFGQFVLEELLPFAESLKTSDGRNIILSRDRNDRMITGCSSGAACAFNAAWTTGEFSRVYSACGSFTGLRGSFTNSTLVHKFEPKPIRFYFQSGSHDMWTSFGDWWSANQAMVRAMEFAGYDFSCRFTENADHCDDNTTQLFPEAMRFLWKGYPGNPPSPGRGTQNAMLRQVLLDGQGFEQVASGIEENSMLLSDNLGKILVSSEKGTRALGDNGDTPPALTGLKALAIGTDNEILAYKPRKGLVIADSAGHVRKKIRTAISPFYAVALRDGGYYIAGKENAADPYTSIWYLSDGYTLSKKADGLKSVRSLALSANNNWLYAFGYDTRRGFSYKVSKEGKDLLHGQEFFYIHVPDQSDGAETASAVCDNYGRTYLATAYGIQICDYNGRSEAILSLPGNAQPVSMVWGGDGMDTLYVLCDNGTVYKRRLNTKGASLSAPMPQIRVGAG